MIKQAKKLSSKTYIQAALKLIPAQPDFLSLQKKNRRYHAHVHNLIDIVLPIAAGSESLLSQKKVFEYRWELLHKQPFITPTIPFETLQDSIRATSNPLNLWNIVKLAIKLIPAEPDESKQSENIQQEPTHDERCEIFLNLAKNIFITEKEVIRFYLTRAQNPGDTTFVELAIKNMIVPPDYLTLSKDNRRKYTDVHRLIDIVLPIVAGSPSSKAQRKLLKHR